MLYIRTAFVASHLVREIFARDWLGHLTKKEPGRLLTMPKARTAQCACHGECKVLRFRPVGLLAAH